MVRRNTMDIGRLHELLRYDAATGHLHWRIKIGRMEPGDVAGSIDKDGYLRVWVDHRLFPAHRLAFAMHHGRWPEHEVDHINRVKTDNRASNIREATPSQNQANRERMPFSTTGYKGVSFNKRDGNWFARIQWMRRRTELGTFSTAEEAARAYDKAAVGKAVEYVNQIFDDADNGEWATIKAHLLAREAEVERAETLLAEVLGFIGDETSSERDIASRITAHLSENSRG